MTTSIVDYLKAKKLASDFQSRQLLWGQFDPREIYVGSAEQNTRLLSALKLGETAPELEIVSKNIQVGEEIYARILSGSEVLIENGLTRTSSNAIPGDTVQLGTSDRFGVFPLHIRNKTTSSLGQLVLIPHEGKVHVDWWSVPSEPEEKSFMITVSDPTKVELLTKFSNHFQDVAGEAAKLAAQEMANTAKASAVMIDVFTGVVVVLISGGAGFVVTTQLAEYGLEFASSFMKYAVDLSPQPSRLSQKEELKSLFATLLSIPRIGLSLVNVRSGGKKLKDTNLKKNIDLCGSIVELQALSDWTIDQFEIDNGDKTLNIAGSLLRNSIENMTAIVCAAQQKK